MSGTVFKKTRTHYEVLGVSVDASHAEIKKSFKALALSLHPDKAGGNLEEFQIVNTAHEVLSNKERKEEYDKSLRPRTNYSSPNHPHPQPPQQNQYFNTNHYQYQQYQPYQQQQQQPSPPPPPQRYSYSSPPVNPYNSPPVHPYSYSSNSGSNNYSNNYPAPPGATQFPRSNYNKQRYYDNSYSNSSNNWNDSNSARYVQTAKHYSEPSPSTATSVTNSTTTTTTSTGMPPGALPVKPKTPIITPNDYQDYSFKRKNEELNNPAKRKKNDDWNEVNSIKIRNADIKIPPNVKCLPKGYNPRSPIYNSKEPRLRKAYNNSSGRISRTEVEDSHEIDFGDDESITSGGSPIIEEKDLINIESEIEELHEILKPRRKILKKKGRRPRSAANDDEDSDAIELLNVEVYGEAKKKRKINNEEKKNNKIELFKSEIKDLNEEIRKELIKREDNEEDEVKIIEMNNESRLNLLNLLTKKIQFFNKYLNFKIENIKNNEIKNLFNELDLNELKIQKKLHGIETSIKISIEGLEKE